MPEKLDSAAQEKLDSAAQIVGEAVGTIKVAIAVIAARVRQGLREAAAIVGASTTADRIGRRSHPIWTTIRQKVVSAKNRIVPTWRDTSEATDATENRTAPTVRKGGGAEKTARKRHRAGEAQSRRGREDGEEAGCASGAQGQWPQEGGYTSPVTHGANHMAPNIGWAPALVPEQATADQ